jgi:hypothetical protein
MEQQLQLDLACEKEMDLEEAVEKQLIALMAELMLTLIAREKETRHDHVTL